MAKNPGKAVVLSAVKNLAGTSEILRCDQNDKIAKKTIITTAALANFSPPDALDIRTGKFRQELVVADACQVFRC